MDELVRFEGLWKTYPIGPGVVALRDIQLRVARGQYLAIMGASGSGKSTMLNILGCLDRPTHGRYWLAGEDVSDMSDNQLSEVRNRRIGFVFQSFNLVSGLSILGNIEVPLFYGGVPRRLRHRRCVEMAELVGLGDRVHHRPAELSGGEQQRVAVARALAANPMIIVADEPTGNLDSHTAEDILDLLDDLHGRGRTIVVVTHEHSIAERAQRVLTLRDGQIASDRRNGPPDGGTE